MQRSLQMLTSVYCITGVSCRVARLSWRRAKKLLKASSCGYYNHHALPIVKVQRYNQGTGCQYRG